MINLFNEKHVGLPQFVRIYPFECGARKVGNGAKYHSACATCFPINQRETAASQLLVSIFPRRCRAKRKH